MAYSFSNSKIYKIEDASDEVRRFFFKMPDDVPFNFAAGQFVMLDLPLESKQTNRSYSIASPPASDNTFELCIKLFKEGLGTRWLWDNATVGTEIKCTTALGKFLLPENIDRDLCFIATGTGVAPIRSMIYDIYNKGKEHKNIYLVFGNRWQKDILYRNEFETFASQYPEFKFIPVLSREDWTGEKGYVHHVYETLFADNRPAYFYICGWNEMVKEAKNNLKTRGYTKHDIKFELYD